MTAHPISPRAYHEPAIFEREMAQLFGRGFQFVGMTDELAAHRDYVCLDLPGKAIVVQNFNGELRAFNNVCSHRFMRIQQDDRGNGPLSCRYHGWAYNKEGYPTISKRAQYGVGVDDSTLCLTRYSVETCGKFVFVDLGGGGSLRAFLGRYAEVLEEMSGAIGAQIHYGTVPHQSNWKVLVENVLDNHHCAVLHRETFVAFGFCRLPLEDTVIEGAHSSFHVPRSELEREGTRRRAFSHLKDRAYAHDSFYHAMIFPNLFVASNEGMSFYVGQAVPQSPGQTALRVRYFEAAMDYKPGQRVRQDLLNEQTRANGLKIIEEDRPILEAVQKGVVSADRPGIVAADEVRIHAFMQSYAERMGSEAALSPPRPVAVAAG